MTTPDDPEDERRRLDPDDSLNMPPAFEGHRSLWESIVITRFGGASQFDQAQLSAAVNTGFIDRNVDPWTRADAREEAVGMFAEYGVSFDWAQWRREMGY